MDYSTEKLFGVSGKVAVVTGAAGGIGMEVCKGLAQVGVKTVLADINGELLEASEKELKGMGLDVVSVVTDVTDSSSVDKMTEFAVDRFGKIDILVNCAGVAHIQDAADFDLDKWEFVMDVNVKGTMLACRSVGKRMIKNKKGRIVNFSSVRGLQGKAGYLAYAPSKGAVNLLTKTLAVEWAKFNVNVNAVAPVFTLTEMNRSILEDKETYEWVLGRIPKARLSEKSCLVGPVLFLCSKASEFVTGDILYVDGGWTAG